MKRLALHALIWTVVFWCLAPFLWQAVTSLKTDAGITQIPTAFLPADPTAVHYQQLFVRKPFARYLLNSAIVSGTATAICVLISALAAYSLSRLKVRGARLVLLLLLGISLCPPIIFFFPLYEMVRATGLANNPIALIIPYVTFNLPLSILMMNTFFKGIPTDIEDAAKVDGFSRMQILFRIMLPLAAPAIATTAILTFINCWNEFLLALTFMTRDSAKTVTAGIATLSGSVLYELPWGAIAAAIVVSTLPLIVLVAVFQRRIVEGLAAGASKG